MLDVNSSKPWNFVISSYESRFINNAYVMRKMRKTNIKWNFPLLIPLIQNRTFNKFVNYVFYCCGLISALSLVSFYLYRFNPYLIVLN